MTEIIEQVPSAEQAIEYEVRLPLYEGPLDVLLRLIERRELEISTISLALVTDQFLAYVAALQEPDAKLLASFLSVAAKLLFIKSQALLPAPPAPVVSADEDEDVGAELVRRLQEYKAVQDLARQLRERESEGLRSYLRQVSLQSRPKFQPKTPSLGLEGVSLNQLLTLVHKRMQLALPLQNEPELIPHQITLAEKVLELGEKVLRVEPGGRLGLWPILLEARSRLEVIVTFTAVLDLMRRNIIETEQDEAFSEIWLLRWGEKPRSAADEAE